MNKASQASYNFNNNASPVTQVLIIHKAYRLLRSMLCGEVIHFSHVQESVNIECLQWLGTRKLIEVDVAKQLVYISQHGRESLVGKRSVKIFGH